MNVQKEGCVSCCTSLGRYGSKETSLCLMGDESQTAEVCKKVRDQVRERLKVEAMQQGPSSRQQWICWSLCQEHYRNEF